jgi:hypothetical protein
MGPECDASFVLCKGDDMLFFELTDDVVVPCPAERHLVPSTLHHQLLLLRLGFDDGRLPRRSVHCANSAMEILGLAKRPSSGPSAPNRRRRRCRLRYSSSSNDGDDDNTRQRRTKTASSAHNNTPPLPPKQTPPPLRPSVYLPEIKRAPARPASFALVWGPRRNTYAALNYTTRCSCCWRPPPTMRSARAHARWRPSTGFQPAADPTAPRGGGGGVVVVATSAP